MQQQRELVPTSVSKVALPYGTEEEEGVPFKHGEVELDVKKGPLGFAREEVPLKQKEVAYGQEGLVFKLEGLSSTQDALPPYDKAVELQHLKT